MSYNVGIGTDGTGEVENVGVVVEIASLSLSVQKLFLLPVYRRHFELR